MTEPRDLSPIHAVVGQTRRRLRIQAAIDGAALATPVAATVAVVTVLGVRASAIGMDSGLGMLAGAAGVIGAGALIGALWPRRDQDVAHRLDRAGGLADRLTTALAFVEDGRDHSGDEIDRAFARLAIADGVHHAARASARAAAPLRAPRHGRVAALSLVLATTVVGLGLRAPTPATTTAVASELSPMRGRAAVGLVPVRDDAGISLDDLDYLRALLEELRGADDDRQRLALEPWADAVAERLAAAERGELDRNELVAAIGELAIAGELQGVAGVEDVLEGVRRSTPLPAPRPPEPPPPPGSCPTSGGGPPGPDGDEPPPVAEAGGRPAPEPGVGHSDRRGEPTRTRAPTEDREIAGIAGTGPTRRQTLRAAARRGFAGVDYRQVYTDYTSIVEEVMHAETVPSAYRYFIKKYFHRIRPT